MRATWDPREPGQQRKAGERPERPISLYEIHSTNCFSHPGEPTFFRFFPSKFPQLVCVCVCVPVFAYSWGACARSYVLTVFFSSLLLRQYSVPFSMTHGTWHLRLVYTLISFLRLYSSRASRFVAPFRFSPRIILVLSSLAPTRRGRIRLPVMYTILVNYVSI